VLILSAAPSPIAVGTGGLLLGSVFRRGSLDTVSTFNRPDQDAIFATRGAWLLETYWGGYICLLTSPAGADILRAPFGDLPCYVTRTPDALLCASDLSLLTAAGAPSPSLDPPALARQLAASDIRRGETCLSGISELPGGERMTIVGGTATRQAIWSPWSFAAPERQLADPVEAARRVEDAARLCVEAQAGEAGHILLKLSGGLDSSIVAACLSRSNRPFTCLTLATDDPAGDERGHAALVAQSLEVALVERFRDVRGVAVDRSAAARLPRPSARSFAQESARIAAEVASEFGANAVFDGGGGDNIFCSLQSVRPVVDSLSTAAVRGAFLRTSAAVAQLAQVSLWAVARRALLSRCSGQIAYRWPLDMRFLSDTARDAASGATAHPWLTPPAGALPGKAAHIALLIGAQSVAEGFDAEEGLPTYSPLISQPLIEVCLRVPSWLWFEDGFNRAVARRAFRDSLPSATIWRRSKGAPDSFIADIYDANLPLIRDLLLGGALRRCGLLDIPQLEAALCATGPVRGHDFLRIMQLADAEVWARCWFAG
jgi:asparagine synthase (glutamine-hydrolysing)